MFDSGTKVKMKFVVFERELFTFSRRQEKRERRERARDRVLTHSSGTKWGRLPRARDRETHREFHR